MRRSTMPSHVVLFAFVLAFIFQAGLVTPARLTAAEPAPQVPVLAVPYLPQTEALCGGAAAAMVFRYWGDRHADVQQFARLVDRRAGGIPDTVLVAAIEAGGWRTERIEGTIDALGTRLERGQPVILLLEDRPSRYHFVVAVGADAGQVTVHDPTWGPARRYTHGALVEQWKRSGYWGLVVEPGSAGVTPTTVPEADRTRRRDGSPGDAVARSFSSTPHPASGAASSRDSTEAAAACQRAMDEAVAAVGIRGLDAADEALGTARAQCPRSSRPVSELAGVRFAQHRFAEASALAGQAVTLDPTDEYAWNVLASSRFVQDDVEGAVQAWNAIGRPMLDSVVIEGLTRTRYAAFAQMLPLEPNTLVTSGDLALTARRVSELPDITGSRVSLTPDDDGWATVRVGVVERRLRPRGAAAWALAAARTAAERELRVGVPGWNGEGEAWSGSWRWWQDRPRVAVALAAPAASPAGGVWRVNGSWMAQRYRLPDRPTDTGTDAGSSLPGEPRREARLYGGISRSNWVSPNLRYDLSAGLGAWDRERRAVAIGGELDRRFARDHVQLAGSVRSWWAIGDVTAEDGDAEGHFRTASARATLRLPDEDRVWSGHASVGVAVASVRAPLSEWPAPGDADAQSPLLRAHGLTRRGIVDSPAFGRRLAFTSVEGRRWLPQPALIRVGIAAFMDAARARKGTMPSVGDRASGGDDGPLLVDVGVGLRISWPGRNAVLRVDYGRGLRDGANAVSIGWQP
jgi:hypothetical protein